MSSGRGVAAACLAWAAVAAAGPQLYLGSEGWGAVVVGSEMCIRDSVMDRAGTGGGG